MMLSLAVLNTALLFGGMTLYSFGFAAIPDLGELSRLPDFVFDKRQGQRASAKSHRRNRHCEKQFIRNTLAHPPHPDRAAAADEHRPACPQEGKGAPC